ncbi:hypothetical protein QT972_09730 [Microcoleus sp. herbarium7]|uniref:hypothetical protein n=1 Tax=Microcoleus sp. herbarium7 TaxID=3055435 RepID=UPI002FCF4AAB
MFNTNAPCAPFVFFRSYSHNNDGIRETWKEVCDRTIAGLKKLGKLTEEETAFLWEQQYNFKCLSSGRWLWVGGREWSERPENFPGAYNCTSLKLTSLEVFGLLMDLGMQGCGTGAVLTEDCINQLPVVRNQLEIEIFSEIGGYPASLREEDTKQIKNLVTSVIWVGDSRKGWVDAYQALIDIAFDSSYAANEPIKVHIGLGSVRPAGEKLKGFGGISNPIKLPELFDKCAALLNGAIGRKLNSVECSLLIDEAAIVIVAGNVRRTAGIRQFDHNDTIGASSKDNLWGQDAEGNWSIDPKRDALRMANQSLVFKHKPTLEECKASVAKQYLSGEGAIQWAGEAVARCNVDLLTAPTLKASFLNAYNRGDARRWLQDHYPAMPVKELDHRLSRFGLNPCGR